MPKYDREPIAWITRGGKHIPIFEKEDIPEYLYHVTSSENADIIDEEGLKANISNKVSVDPRFDQNTKVVYAFSKMEDAEDFAYDNNMEDNFIIYKIKTEGLDIKRDPEYGGNKSFVILSNISTKRIKRLKKE